MIKDLLAKYNLTQTQFSKEFEIPLRTVQNWCNEVRRPPSYVVKLIEFKLKGIYGENYE